MGNLLFFCALPSMTQNTCLLCSNVKKKDKKYKHGALKYILNKNCHLLQTVIRCIKSSVSVSKCTLIQLQITYRHQTAMK